MSLQLYHQEEFKSMEISYLDGEQRQFLEDVLSRFLIYNKGILDQIPGWTISQRIPLSFSARTNKRGFRYTIICHAILKVVLLVHATP